jgi:hypothetical protein
LNVKENSMPLIAWVKTKMGRSGKGWISLPALLPLLVLLAGCGGGGGGGGGTPTSVTGRVLNAETGAPPNNGATVTIGGASAQTAADGTFTLANVPSTTTSGTVASSGAQTRTLTLALTAGQANNLGDVYITSDPAGYTANVTGRIITLDKGQPVGNATVILAGSSTKSGIDGTFTLTGLPVGLGNTSGTFGVVKASGFEDKPITADVLRFPLAQGSNPLGDIPIASTVGTTPPNVPYTIAGTVTVHGQKPSAGQQIQVTLSAGSNVLGTMTADANGNYSFWVVPATYTVSVSLSGFTTKQVSVTLARLDRPVTAPTVDLNQ